MNAIGIYRMGRWFVERKLGWVAPLFKNAIFLIYNSYIPVSADIGSGTVFAYGAIGVVLHGKAKIGKNCVIGQGVTIGSNVAAIRKEENGCPVIGNNCYIGAGARILGEITIGDNCQIGAGAVVTKSIPANSIVVGVPARIIGVTDDKYLAIEK